MRYKHLSRNRWLDTQPEELCSYAKCITGTNAVCFVAYPGLYQDASPDPDMGRYRRALADGFRRIVISDSDPNGRAVEQTYN